jgi:hypothetical protein
MTKKHYRVGVRKLVDLLYPRSPEDILRPYRDRKDYESGRVIHLKLGYVGGETFRRIYVDEDEGYSIEIIGSPDRVNYEEGCVEELKTFRDDRAMEIQKEIGRLQLAIYCWIIGVRRAILKLYNPETNEVETIYYEFTPEELEKIVGKAVRKYIKVIEALRE